MKSIKRIKYIGAKNRVGMIYDVLQAMVSYGVNIETMELNPPFIYFKIEWDDGNSWTDFKDYMKKRVKETDDLVEIDMMNYEKKAKELDTVISNINEGVIALDKDGCITYFNKTCAKILGLNKKDSQGRHINAFIPNQVLNARMCSKDRDNIELVLKNHNKQLNLMMDIRVIKNEAGVVTGSLIILRKIDDLRQLMQSISRPSMITFEDIIGESRAFKNALLLAKSVARSNSAVMLRGESGTGKELFARAIHEASLRCEHPFVAINCAAVPESLLESEFFGYERGAFTGASSSGKQGLFELATRGTLFLDEIGDLPVHLQAKILRAIQEQKVRRLGGEREISIDVRIISATNKNLEEMIEDGTFREDLYYRLNVIPIYIPPLRERKTDIPLLARHFISALGKAMNKTSLELTDEALETLLNYDWPGNIRELQNVIERAMNLADESIEKHHLMIQKDNKKTMIKRGMPTKGMELPVNLPKIFEEIEYYYLKQAKKIYTSSREIASALGISHTSALNKIRKYNID